MFAFTRFNLARQFMVVSFIVFFSKTIFVGSWASAQIEIREMSRVAAAASLNVGSYIAPHLQDLPPDNLLRLSQTKALDYFFSQTSFGRQLVAYRVWGPERDLLYSTLPEQSGQQVALSDKLTRAFSGEIKAVVVDAEILEQSSALAGAPISAAWDRLVQVSVPIMREGSGEIVAVVELYQKPDQILPQVQVAQQRRWLGVAITMGGIFLLLAGFVAWSSKTILAQQVDLKKKVKQLQHLLEQNTRLNGRVRRAAGRTTALNEQFLARISADLHDGPCQDLAFGLLHMERLVERCHHSHRAISSDINTVHTALDSALVELRDITSGLRLPQLCHLSPENIVRRAIRDYQRKTNCPVTLACNDLPDELPLPVKITLYRVVQEALSNGFRHACGAGQTVCLKQSLDELCLEVIDEGPGFDPAAVSKHGHLGLVGMCERVEILGGRFEIETGPDQGTKIMAHLPLIIPEGENG